MNTSHKVSERRIIIYHRRNLFQQANDLCLHVVQHEPENLFAHFHLALGYYRLGMLRLALQHALVARRLSPNTPNVHLNLGCIYDALKRARMAVWCYRRELTLYPNCCEALYNLGMFYHERHRYSEALPYLRKCYRLGYALKAIVITLAFCYNKLGLIQDEIRLYEDYLKSHPRNRVCLMNLGAACLDKSRYKESFKFLKRAERLAPRNPIISRNLSKVKRMLG